MPAHPQPSHQIKAAEAAHLLAKYSQAVELL
jgi:hypothetical protein